MNSQNTAGKNSRPRPTMPQNPERYSFPSHQSGVMDPYAMMGGYYMQPQMQMMLKWRNQMAHMVRNSPEAMQNSYQYMEPTSMHSSYLGSDFPGMMPPPIEPVFDQTRKEYANYQMKMSEQMFPYNHFPMMHPSMHMPMMPNKPHNFKIMGGPGPHFPSQYPYQEKRRPVQRERPSSIMPNKEPHVIVIDEEQEVVPEVIEKKPEVIQMIQEVPPIIPKETKHIIAQRIARMTCPAPKIYSKKASKPVVAHRVSSDEKIEEDSFKPSGFRSKKIQKKKLKVQRERTVRHRETERQKVLKEKKTIQQEKTYSSKPNDQQGKIMISSFHQAKIPEYRFGQPQYQKQKQRTRQSLKERFEFQGSLHRDQYKRIKQSLNSWPPVTLINVVKNKFSNQPLPNPSIQIIQDSDQKILQSVNTSTQVNKKNPDPFCV